MRTLAYASLAASVLLGLGLLGWHLSVLPEQIATHFNAAGEPDDFMSRKGYAVLMISLIVGTPAVFVGMMQLVRFLPPSMINIPNRDYWLGESRRKETLAWVDDWMVWISLSTEGLLIGISQLTFDANIRQGNLNTLGLFVLMGFYLISVFALVVWLYLKFRLPSALSEA